MNNINWIRSRHYTITWDDLRPLPSAPSPETNLRVDYDASGKVLNMEWMNRVLPSFDELYQEFLTSKDWPDTAVTREVFEAGWDAARS
jgi:hypothetical protein